MESISLNIGDELSILGLFLRADIIVQIIMGLLLLLSVWCWSVIFSKIALIRSFKSKSKRFQQYFWSGQKQIDELYNEFKDNSQFCEPIAKIFVAAYREFKVNTNKNNRNNALSRVDQVIAININRKFDELTSKLSILATVGSTAPFIGLLGTVWGIMNSFSAIAATNQTSLSVVAPGIAEALFATALGLLAAIPATIFYNKLSNDINLYINEIQLFSDELSVIFARNIKK